MMLIILLLGTVMIVMTLLGGSWAATAGDFVQMLVVLTITVVMAALTLGHEQIGGMGGLIEKMPKAHLDWTEFSRPSIILIFFSMLMVNQIISLNSMQTGAARYLFVKDGKDARKSAVVSVVGFIFLPVIWIIPAIGAAIIFPDLSGSFPQLNNANEAAYVAIAMELLPQGLLGLLVCGIFAASLTSMNSSLNTMSASFVRNFYIRVLEKDASEAKQILLGRAFILFYGVSWMIVAMLFSQIKELQLFDLILIVAASIGLPAALPLTYGMFIKKTPAWTGWSTMVIGFIVSVADRFLLTPEFMQSLWGQVEPLTKRELGDLNIALTTGTIFFACTVWFLFTMLFHKYSHAAYKEQVDHFFTEMNTPIDRSEEHEPDYENDQRQYGVLANLCLAYGVLTLLLLAVPNDLKARVLILLCGGIVVVVGMVLRTIGRKISTKNTN
jgi:Na+/proline symporter